MEENMTEKGKKKATIIGVVLAFLLLAYLIPCIRASIRIADAPEIVELEKRFLFEAKRPDSYTEVEQPFKNTWEPEYGDRLIAIVAEREIFFKSYGCLDFSSWKAYRAREKGGRFRIEIFTRIFCYKPWAYREKHPYSAIC